MLLLSIIPSLYICYVQFDENKILESLQNSDGRWDEIHNSWSPFPMISTIAKVFSNHEYLRVAQISDVHMIDDVPYILNAKLMCIFINVFVQISITLSCKLKLTGS